MGVEEVSGAHLLNILEALILLIDGQKLARTKLLECVTLWMRALHRMGWINLRCPEMHRNWRWQRCEGGKDSSNTP